MGDINIFRWEKIIAGIIYNPAKHEFDLIQKELEFLWGEIDYISDIIDFAHTSYYEKEMGRGLKKVFVSFLKLVKPEILPDIKIASNNLEEKLSSSELRTINIDPGFINQSKLILASTKDFSHRIPLRDGIFAEVTLCYAKKKWQNLPWTFPDFQTERYHCILTDIRDIYSKQILNYGIR